LDRAGYSVYAVSKSLTSYGGFVRDSESNQARLQFENLSSIVVVFQGPIVTMKQIHQEDKPHAAYALLR
jgi:hypothetical protein